MPNTRLLPHRQNHVFKIYDEIKNYASSSTPDRECQKVYFLNIIPKNNELNESEKNYCQEMFIRNYELHNVIHKFGEPITCKNCKSTRYSIRYCEVCIKQYLQKSFRTWTSGNRIVDEFIQKCQLISSVPPYIIEWIPFEQFKDVEYLTKGGFSTVYTATWPRGSIYDWDENKKMFIYFEYFGPQKVVLKSLNNSNYPGKDFFDELCEFANYEFVNIYKDGKSILISPNSNLEKINKPHPFASSSSRILSGIIPKSIRISNYVTSQYDFTLSEEMSEFQNDESQ
ncbi:11253_t:CDS:2 [Scutellospora calospora]|uniref:11253_t:CDS:1 n=1 Tax=Scutellospora calospora TaxID=85575 RepID=A0ACA9L173_9GLOM|nr:11253_t:CDS:2 [Scutellospora calospora]